MKFLDQPPRFLFFTGKGGVGKTSIACATAIQLAGAGKARAAGQHRSGLQRRPGLRHQHRQYRSPPFRPLPGLAALEIDPQAAAQAYRDRIVGPVRGVLPETVVKGIEEQLSGACTTEIAAFDEFTALLTDSALTADYDHIIFDTAPTGHTIRLLQLPGAWSGFLGGRQRRCLLSRPAGRSGKAARPIQGTRSMPGRSPAHPPDSGGPRPAATLREVARTHEELAAIGLQQQYLVINGVLPRSEADTRSIGRSYLRSRADRLVGNLPDVLKALPCDQVTLKPFNLVGLDALRQLLTDTPVHGEVISEYQQIDLDTPSLSALVDDIAADGHGLVMLMGKGGVGKTTLAAAVAVELAHRGLPVHLTTSDPAAHLTETLNGALDNLTVSRIDPHAETETLPAACFEDQRRKARCPRPCAAGRRPALALHRGNRRVPGVFPHYPRSRARSSW